jgi:hypothetical protein
MRGTTGGGVSPRPDSDDAARFNGKTSVTSASTGTVTAVLDDSDRKSGASSSSATKSAPAPRREKLSASGRVTRVTEDLFPPGREVRAGKRRRRLAVLVTAGAVVVVTVGAWSLTSRSSTTAGATPAATVANSARTTVAAGTANLALTMRVHVPGSGAMVATGSGAVDLPANASRVAFTFRGRGALSGVQLREVFVGDTIYLSIPQLSSAVAGKPWISQPLTPRALVAPRNSDPGTLLGMLAATGNRVTPLGASTIDGSAVRGYRVTVAPSGLPSGLRGSGLSAGVTRATEEAAGTGADVVTVYVDDHTGMVRSMVADIDLTLGSHPVVAVVTEDLTGYGAPTAVTPPAAAQVLTLSQFRAAVQGATPTVST